MVAIVTKKSRKIIQGAGVGLINADQKIRFQAFPLYQFDKYLLHFGIVGE
ncbi:hypothetical protein [Okeania sp. SIO2B3]|nr:hypothetical protein [Okeania sp. SIO2B3]NET41906.1 hypothetical protein [Okeania sp. SIO2B3]